LVAQYRTVATGSSGSNPDDPALVFLACRRIDGNGYP
jgi:hypothetical protein